MEAATKRILRAALALPASELRELEAEIKRYREGGEPLQRSFRESLTMDLGPLGGGRCPVCGK